MTTGWRKQNPKYPFTVERDQVVREAYTRTYKFGQRDALLRAAEKIGYPKHAIIKRGRALGLARAKEKPWSDAELALLEQLGRYAPETIARKFREAGLNRSTTGILLKRKRLGLKAAIEGEWSAHQVAEAMGVDSHKVMRWIASSKLHAELLGHARKGPRHGDTRWIRRADLLAFLFDYPNEYDFAAVDKFWLLEQFRHHRSEFDCEEESLP